MRQFSILLVFLGAILTSIGTAAAQTTEIRDVGDQLQEDFPYSIGEPLNLNIRIGGIHWSVLRIGAGEEADWTEGKKTKVTVSNDLENLTDSSLYISIILLLEDERGHPLERIELRRIKVGAGQFEENRQKFKADGGSLSQTAMVYVFAEVE